MWVGYTAQHLTPATALLISIIPITNFDADYKAHRWKEVDGLLGKPGAVFQEVGIEISAVPLVDKLDAASHLGATAPKTNFTQCHSPCTKQPRRPLCEAHPQTSSTAHSALRVSCDNADTSSTNGRNITMHIARPSLFYTSLRMKPNKITPSG